MTKKSRRKRRLRIRNRSRRKPSLRRRMTPEQVKQRKFDKDSAELLHLVQELKVEVEKAGANTLSLAALRKADEIQKLAKDLKERMKEQGQTFASKP